MCIRDRFSFKERVTTNGSKDGQEIALVSTTERTETNYSGRGLVQSQSETQVRSDAPDLKTVTVMDAMTYNALGLLNTYTQTANEKDATGTILKTRSTTREITEYDPFQLVLAFDETVQTTGIAAGQWLEDVYKRQIQSS